MTRDPDPTLPIPSCAEAQTLGLAMPQMLCDMERAIGWPAVRPFLARYAGQRVDIPVRPASSQPDELRPAFDWLRAELGFGRISIPLGPMRRGARLAWAVRALSRDGMSSDRIARRLGHGSRTVQRYRTVLRAHGHDLTPQSDRTPDR